MRFAKAHAYGNDFLYVRSTDVEARARVALAREMCDRHAGVGADGLIFYEHDGRAASMTLLNADGSRAEVSGNGVRGLAALLLRDERSERADITIRTEAGEKILSRLARSGSQQTFRGSMGSPQALRQAEIDVAGEPVPCVTLNMGNPQCVILGPIPPSDRFRRLGALLEKHGAFADGTNVEFAEVEAPDRLRILIWERGVGPTTSSGTGSCAALVAAAAFGGAAREADVIAPGGTQRVEWREDGVFLTGWAEVICEGEWLRQDLRTSDSPHR